MLRDLLALMALVVVGALEETHINKLFNKSIKRFRRLLKQFSTATMHLKHLETKYTYIMKTKLSLR